MDRSLLSPPPLSITLHFFAGLIAKIQTKSAFFSIAQATRGGTFGVRLWLHTGLTRLRLQIFRAGVHTRLVPHFRTLVGLSDDSFSITFQHPAEKFLQ
jgi:hypothetical protein